LTAASGVPAPATRWFLAEGATGTFFDLFVLIANPSASTAQIRVSYLTQTGQTFSRTTSVAPNSRQTLWVDQEVIGGSDCHDWDAAYLVAPRITSRPSM